MLRLKRWDKADRVQLLPLQAEEAPRLAGRARHELEQAAHVVLPDGSVYAGAAALRELCRYLPWGGAVRAVFALPGAMPFAERVYRWIARTKGPVGSRPQNK